MRDLSGLRGLTLTQPWASAIALGHKRVETRSFRVSYRGPIAIHAAKRFPRAAREFAADEQAAGRMPMALPLGSIVAVANLRDCAPTEDVLRGLDRVERLYGDYTPGRWALFLADIYSLSELIPCRGALGLWRVPASVIDRIMMIMATDAVARRPLRRPALRAQGRPVDDAG